MVFPKTRILYLWERISQDIFVQLICNFQGWILSLRWVGWADSFTISYWEIFHLEILGELWTSIVFIIFVAHKFPVLIQESEASALFWHQNHLTSRNLWAVIFLKYAQVFHSMWSTYWSAVKWQISLGQHKCYIWYLWFLSFLLIYRFT